jgi:DNA-directed RNA polymerase specialized sigma24 family protein
VELVTTAASAGTSADDALVRRARSGDAAAFGMLVDTRLDRCYRLAWSILSNDADAADATQDALVSAWRQLPRLRDPATFDGWLNRIVANAALMARRHRVRLREVSVGRPTPARKATSPNRQDLHARTEGPIVDNDAIRRVRPPAAAGRMILAPRTSRAATGRRIARSLRIPSGRPSGVCTPPAALEKAMEAEA